MPDEAYGHLRIKLLPMRKYAKLRKMMDSQSMFSLKSNNYRRRYPSISYAADNTLCGQEGSVREQHCQMTKLTLLSVLPGIILIVRNAVSLSDNVTTYEANKFVKENIQFSIELGEVLHACQIERGTTALYVSSGGDPFVLPRLLQQYRDTDQSIISLSKWIPMPTPANFASRGLFHKSIREFRYNLYPENATLEGVIAFYSSNNAEFTRMIGRSTNLEKALIYWTDLVAYQMLILSKEQAGVERALGSTYYARGSFPLDDLYWYREKKMLGSSYLDQCTMYSTFTKRLIEKLYLNSKLAADLMVMRELISNNTPIVPSVVSGSIWFDNMTEYINILKNSQDDLANSIIEKTKQQINDLEESIILSSVELIIAIVLVPIIIVCVRNIVRKIQSFAEELKSKTGELVQERKRTEGLLYQLLPRTVARKLMEDGHSIPEAFHSATILFSDVVGFTNISSRSTPMQVVNMLNKLYMTIDARLENYDVYKVETIGDGYMVASGLPSRNGDRHVEEIAKLSLDLLETLYTHRVPHLENEKIRLRIGFNTGSCVAGIVGIRMPRYCVFGDTVNTASRMESTSLPLKVQMTESSALKLRDKDIFVIKERGTFEIKGKGKMKTYWLDGYTNRPINNAQITVNTSRESIRTIQVMETPGESIR